MSTAESYNVFDLGFGAKKLKDLLDVDFHAVAVVAAVAEDGTQRLTRRGSPRIGRTHGVRNLDRIASAEVERFTAFGPRFLDEGVNLGARTLVIDDFFPTLVTFCKLAQLIKHGTTLGFAQLGSSLMISDALTGEIIIPLGNLSGERVTESFSEDQPS